MDSEPKIIAGKLVLPHGMTKEQARHWIEQEIAESHADDARSLQLLGAAMVREHARIAENEDRIHKGNVNLHDIGEAYKLLGDIRHEVGRAKGHLGNRRIIRERWEEKLAKLEANGDEVLLS